MKSVLSRNLGFLGYPNYEVDIEGNVWSLDYNHTGENRLMKPYKEMNGYYSIRLWNEHGSKKLLVHRLVVDSFIPNPDNLPEVNYKNEDKTNNNVENLEWCTHEYNQNWGTRNERASKKLKGHIVTDNSKLKNMISQPNRKPLQQFTLDGELIATYQSIKEAQRVTGVKHQHISDCCKGKYKQSGGFIWKYKEEGN